MAQCRGYVREASGVGSSSFGFTFHEDVKNISEGGGGGSKGTDGEEEGADGVSCLVLRLQRKRSLSPGKRDHSEEGLR